MQFDVEKQILLKAISNVNGAVEKKKTLAVLQKKKFRVERKLLSTI